MLSRAADATAAPADKTKMAPLTVIIPALDAAEHLPRCLTALKSATAIIVIDGGSADNTAAIAGKHGAAVHTAAPGRGEQLRAGAAHARTDWMLFLHADTVLDAVWHQEANAFMSQPSNISRAAVFQFALDDPAPQARRLERAVNWRTRTLGLPYGDQGLLIHRQLYNEIGGFRSMPIMEDVDIIRRIGRKRIVRLDACATTSALRWKRDGWYSRSARNLMCLGLYLLGVPPHRIIRIYER